jgi:hypothetical protein
MNPFGARFACDAKQLLDVQVTLRGRSGTEEIRFIRHARMQRIAIDFGINRDRLDTHLSRRADDAHRNLAAIRDKDPFKHAVSS